MDSELVTTKLESLARCIDRIRAKTPPDLDTLRHDVDTQDILAVNLERAVQICVDVALHTIARRTSWPVPETMAEAFRVLEAQAGTAVPAVVSVAAKRPGVSVVR